MYIHLFFDLLAYGVAGYLSWRYFRGSSVIKDIDVRWYYYTTLVAGFVIGSVGLSMFNNYLSLGGKVILGKSILGALFGGILFSEIFKRFMGIEGSTGAYFVPSLAIGIAIGRIGCFWLGLVEREIATVLTENDQIAVAALPDVKKGEKLVLLLEGEMQTAELQEQIKGLGLNPLFVPSEYYKVESLPKLGTGKADFKGAKRLAAELSVLWHSDKLGE